MKNKRKFKNLKERINFYFEDVETFSGRLTDFIIIGLVVISSIIYVILSYPLPEPLRYVLENTDNTIIIIFTFEYILRFWVAEKKLKHFFSIHSIIDLIAVLPLYLGFTGLGFVRILRVFRMLKLIRFMKRKHLVKRIENEDVYTLVSISFVLFSLIFVSSGLIYFTEHRVNPEAVATFFDAVYYSVVTMSTVGLGDIVPISTAGRIVTMSMIVSAIILIPWQISVFLKGLIRAATKIKVTCQHCGLQHHDNDASHCKECGHILFSPDRKG
jgi:voltage-gated potassium channel|tara:strand:- start:2316 stop:3128 length:813 start_codon:yes stop_codon:yes gene_type:complete